MPEPPEFLKHITNTVISKVEKSVANQEPSWRNVLSRKISNRTPENNTDTFNTLLGNDKITPQIIDILYGKNRPNVQIIEIDNSVFDALEDNEYIRLFCGQELIPFRKLKAFTLKKTGELFLAVLDLALNMKTAPQFPVIILRKESSIVAKAHELTHAASEEPTKSITTLHDYIRNPEERKAFVNSILIYRLANPQGSFYDFVRIQEGLRIEEFPDERIEHMIEVGKSAHGLQKYMWESITKQLGTNSSIDTHKLSQIKSTTLHQADNFVIISIDKPLTIHQDEPMDTNEAILITAGKSLFENLVEKKLPEAVQDAADVLSHTSPANHLSILNSIARSFEHYFDIDQAKVYYERYITDYEAQKDHTENETFWYEKAKLLTK